jgi:rubredoxin
MAKHVLCAECGWSGERTELERIDDERQCPVCAEVVEFVD